MSKKFLWLRVQRYFPKGSGIQQPEKSRVFKNPFSKTLTVHPILATLGTLWHNNMSTYGKFTKSLTQFWVECANSSFLGGGASCEGNHAGVASWDKFTQVKGTFTR